MAGEKSRTFGEVLRRRRRELDLTQGELANMIDTSTPYVGLLESDQRHPSDAIVTKLADALGLERGELFFLANPDTRELLKNENEPPKLNSAWEAFRADQRLHRLHNVTTEEMGMLSRVALMGEIGSPREFVYILNTVRQALSR
jgi:transcriptional regulator with XRE-family HTH domain